MQWVVSVQELIVLTASAHHTFVDAVQVAVIVNDMAEINIDSQLVTQGSSHSEGIVELTNGCICCTLRDDLVQVRRPLTAPV